MTTPLPAPYSTMAPADIAVAVRSLPRRWRQLFGDVGDDSDVAELATRPPGSGGPSALEHLITVAASLDRAATEIRSLRGSGEATLADPAMLAASGRDRGLERALDDLDAAAARAAAEIDDVPADSWARSGSRAGRPVDLLTRARETVRDGVEHLRAAERVLRDVRAQAG